MVADPDQSFRARRGRLGTVYVAPGFEAEVESLGFDLFENVMSFAGGEHAGKNRRRDVVRILNKGRAWFLKRFGPPKASEVFRSALMLRLPETPARIEARMSLEFEAAGLKAGRVAAFGESEGSGRSATSFLLTPAVDAESDLFDVASRRAMDPTRERSMKTIVHRLAETVKRMHDAGLTHPDLYSYHIFPLGAEAERGFAFIDLQRARRVGRVSLSRAARDLAGLMLSFPPGTTKKTDRVRFLRAYTGERRLEAQARALIRLVDARAAKIAGRRRFREIRDGNKP